MRQTNCDQAHFSVTCGSRDIAILRDIFRYSIRVPFGKEDWRVIKHFIRLVLNVINDLYYRLQRMYYNRSRISPHIQILMVHKDAIIELDWRITRTRKDN